MGEQQRKRYTSEDKVAVLKEHLAGKKPVSEVCERHGIAVNMFYRWQEEFFAKAAGVFDGPQFVAKDFKEFIRLAGMTHVRTSPFYPQSNGKLERWHHSLKSEAVRLQSLSDRGEAERVIAEYIRYYNEERLNSAIGYIAPADKLAGREKLIFAGRDRKLEEARKRRAQARQPAA